MQFKKEYSSDLVLHFQKVRELTRDSLEENGQNQRQQRQRYPDCESLQWVKVQKHSILHVPSFNLIASFIKSPASQMPVSFKHHDSSWCILSFKPNPLELWNAASRATEHITQLFSQAELYSSWRINCPSCVKSVECPHFFPGHFEDPWTW